jgi:hypothetical protein
MLFSSLEDTWITKCARRLHNYVSAHESAYPKRGSAATWEREIKQLIQLLNVSKERIVSTVDWFVKGHLNNYKVNIKSASGFRKRFCEIEKIMVSSVLGGRFPTISIGELTKEEKSLVYSIASSSWPKNIEEQLPGVIRQSFLNYKEFLNKLGNFKISNKKLANFRDYLLEELPLAFSLIESWFRKESARVHDWLEWSGKLYPITVTNKRFQEIGEDYSQRFSNGNKQLWHDLLWEMKIGNKS